MAAPSLHSVASSSRPNGQWEPLPAIIYAVVIHPLAPYRTQARPRSRIPSSPTLGDTDPNDPHATDDAGTLVNPHQESLEVGDEVYAFEKFVPEVKTGATWYRGYVVSSTQRPPAPLPTSESTLSVNGLPTQAPSGAAPDPEVKMGLFPASHIHVRDQLPDSEGQLAEIYSRMIAGQIERSASTNSPAGAGPSASSGPGMGTLREEDEDPHSLGYSSPTMARPRSPRGPRGARPQSSVPSRIDTTQLLSPSSGDHSNLASAVKHPPPHPMLKSGDETIAGASQPLIDEIASALREWHSLMFKHLQRRDYKLFTTVKEHIDVLHLGRRQLLTQTLSMDELINLRKDCVLRLVKGNVSQGLDVIVRHPTWGGLVTVETEGQVDSRSWMSAVRMYALQVSLAYIDHDPSGAVSFHRSSALNREPLLRRPSLSSPTSPTTPTSSSFLNETRRRRPSSAGRLSSFAPTPTTPSTRQGASFFHLYLDLRAFVASPCAPGETTELYFSLYNKSTEQFFTEEFCAILNHNGVLARNANSSNGARPGHIHVLFRDLSQQDVQCSIFLVCRIVRNGAMKLANTASSISPPPIQRRGSGPLTSAIPEEGSSPVPDGRNGSISAGKGFSPDSSTFRRPFGAAAVELSVLSQIATEQTESTGMTEHTVPIYVPTNEAKYATLHQDIINGSSREYEKSPRAEMIAVVVKAFYGDAETVVRENPSLLQDVPITSRLGFPDVVFPGDVRNEFYIKLWSGEFFHTPSSGGGRIRMSNFGLSGGLTGSNIGLFNVQVTVEVRTRAGAVVEGAISQGTGEPNVTRFHSMVFYRNNTPTFGELIKLALPATTMHQCHLFFTFRNRNSKERGSNGKASNDPHALDKPIAFAYLPLFPDATTFVQDGSHTLVLYRADRGAWSSAEDYFDAPPLLPPGEKVENLEIPPKLIKTAMPIRDSLVIRSLLCSTELTQNPVLLALLNWETLPDRRTELETVLSKFTFVGEVEIVKFLRKIFDSLFAIMVSNTNRAGELDHLVFNALVLIINIAQDRRFGNFQPVLEVYISQHFSFAAASSHMLRAFNHLLSDPVVPEAATLLRKALKVWHYLLRFIVRARELQKAREVGMGTTSEHLEAAFKKELWAHLGYINKLMSISSPTSVGTQTIALQQFSSILPDLAQAFSPKELVSAATGFANALTNAKGRLVIWKLIMYLNLVRGFLFANPISRSDLVEAIVEWIKPHLGRYDEFLHTQLDDKEEAKDAARIAWLENLRLSTTIIAVMLDRLQQVLADPEIINDRKTLRSEEANVEYLLSLLPRVLESYLEFQMPTNLKSIERVRTAATTPTPVPVCFPSSYPFSLISNGSTPSSTFINGVLHEVTDYFNCGLGEVAIVFIAMILAATPKDIVSFLELTFEIEGRDNLTRLLTAVFNVGTSILNNDAYPARWLNVNVLAHKVFLKLADAMSGIMTREYIPQEQHAAEFDRAIWFDYLYMVFKLLSSDQLVIEEFSPQKRRAVWKLAGDVRGDGAALLLRCWEALGWPDSMTETGIFLTKFGGYQVTLVELVDYVLNLCLSHHELLRTNAVQILYSMIISEYQVSSDFSKIETALINKLDEIFMSESRSDDVSRALFVNQLRNLFESASVDDELRTRVTELLVSVDHFLELLLVVRQLPDGEEYMDDRVIATLRLMNFIRHINRDEIYIKYVHELVNMHIQSNNYVEAALTLKLHYDLHEWDLLTFVEPLPDLNLPRQSSFVRKETLCMLILDYLGKGKAWESAIGICQELAKQHMEVTFNYGRLAEVLNHQAQLLQCIMSDQRYYPEYFRVAFYGNFPTALRDKQFIYRGYEWEKYPAFCERMLQKHSGAILYQVMEEPDDDIRYGSQQYIHCTPVTPEPDRTSAIFTNPDVPVPVRTYYEHSAVNIFSFSRPFTKRPPGSHVEFQDVWTEKTYMTTEELFPTVLRRSEVVEIEMAEISPVQGAIIALELQNKELSLLDIKYTAAAKVDAVTSTNALTMALNEIVDVPPDSGLWMYRQTFLAPIYVVGNPDQEPFVKKLRATIDEQARIVDRCLKLHGMLCPEEMMPFHEALENFFRSTFADEIQRLPSEDPMTSNLESFARTAPQTPQSPTAPTYYGGNGGQGGASITSSQQHGGGGAMTVGRNVPSLYVPSSATTSRVPDFSHLPPLPAQTPLQRHLAHLTRHGMGGVSAGPQTAQFDVPQVPLSNGAAVGTESSIRRLSYSTTDAGPGRHQPYMTGNPSSDQMGASRPSLQASTTSRLSRFGSLLKGGNANGGMG